MTFHPNRSRRDSTPAANPSPDAIRAARADAGLTQTQAAHLIHATMRAWQEWEAGTRRMHPGLWELFKLKSGRSRDLAGRPYPNFVDNVAAARKKGK